MENLSPSEYKYIAEDMAIYIGYKEHQIHTHDLIEDNFNMNFFLRSKDTWKSDLSEAIDAFTNKNDNQHILDCMERVDEIEEQVLSLTDDLEDE